MTAFEPAALLRTMWRIRAFEERVSRLARNRQAHGLLHLSIGGEGVAAAVCSQLRHDDVVYTGHRPHGHAIAKGVALDELMAELMGRADGLCMGLGGSMHIVDAQRGLFGATGVVGGNLPLAVGNALAVTLAGGDQVTVVFFGDGAAQAGHFTESVNLAALWQLPVVFVCENNGMAEFTTRAEHTPIGTVSEAVAPYDFPTQTVQGSDPQAVWDAFATYLQAARRGEGPFLLECLTHRRSGHYEGDAQKYRDPEAEAEWLQRDPIARLRGVDEDVAAQIEREARAEVERAVEFARGSPHPEPGAADAVVYAT